MWSGYLRELLLACLLVATCGFSTKERYCVVLDAGSTGSRVHVYRFQTMSGGILPRVEQVGGVMKNREPLSTFLEKPAEGGASLVPLIKHAMELVPVARRSKSSVHMMATAGMRLLDTHRVEAILESCREVLAKSGFRFKRKWAGLLPGSSEGIYGFVAANYLSGALQKPLLEPDSLLGVVELGGASLQVTFMVSSGLGNARLYHVRLGGADLTLFTHSFLGLGQDSAQQLGLKTAQSRLEAAALTLTKQKERAQNTTGVSARHKVLDPCLPQGYDGLLNGVAVSGGGYFSRCREASSEIVAGDCMSQHCGVRGLHVPPLAGKFLCIENLQYTAGFLGLPESATIAQMLEAAEKTCGTPWQDMLARYPTFEPEHLLSYCFGAAYGMALLHDGLGVNMQDNTLLFTDTITAPDGHPVTLDWTLGAVVVAAAEGAEGFAALDREFPFFEREGVAQAGGFRNIREESLQRPRQRSGLSTKALVVGGLLALIAAGIWVRLRRGSRKRRRLRHRRLKPIAKQRSEENGWESEDECTDSEGARLRGASTVERRPKIGRSGDLEEG